VSPGRSRGAGTPACRGDVISHAPRELTLDNFDPSGVRSAAAVRSREFRVSNGLSKSRFLTVQEVADLMRVSSMTVYRLIKAGELPAVRVGRSFRVSEPDVDAYLASRYTQAG
jgi:excisionase family DNA binding protein